MCIAGRSLNQLIDHFTVAALVTWPLNESDAGARGGGGTAIYGPYRYLPL